VINRAIASNLERIALLITTSGGPGNGARGKSRFSPVTEPARRFRP